MTPLSRQRSFLKCSRCRRHKRKCEPEERNWDAGQRCRNCVAAGAPCGPNVPHPRSSFPPLSPSSSVSPETAFASSSALDPGVSVGSASRPPTATTRCDGSPPGFTGQRSTRSHENPVEEKVLSQKDLTRNKLIELGNQGDLFRFLRGRQIAVAIARPVKQSQKYDNIYDLVTTVLHFAKQKYSHICEQIITALQQLPRSDRETRELFLRRFNEKLTQFLSLGPDLSDEEHQGDDYADLKRRHCSVVSQLAVACEDNGDPSEGFRLRAYLKNLQDSYNLGAEVENKAETSRFQQLSIRMSETFRSLKLPFQYAKLLPKAENFFPAAHLAIDAGRTATARGIIGSGLCHPSECDILSRQALHIAAETGDDFLLRLVLQHHPSARAETDAFKMTAICIAAYIGDLDVFASLAEPENDFSSVEVSGRSVLAIAAGAGHLRIVQYMLRRGCNPNYVDELEPSGSYSALHAAAAAGFFEVVKVLVDNNASALWPCNGLTPAQEASKHGHEQIAHWLRNIEKVQGDELPRATTTLPHSLDHSSHAWQQQFVQSLGPDPMLSTMSSPSVSTATSATMMYPPSQEFNRDPVNGSYPISFGGASPFPSVSYTSRLSTPSIATQTLKRGHPPSRSSSSTPSDT